MLSLLKRKLFLGFTLLWCTTTLLAADYDAEIDKLRHDWAVAKYQTAKDQRLPALEKLISRAKILDQQHPHQTKIMVWYATVLSTYASIKGGLGSLPYVKKARDLLEDVTSKDSRAENGFAQGVLGTLYARVPGWPIGFGDKGKARQHLLLAVQIDPHGIDSNYFYGDFLVDDRAYDEAGKYLEAALHAPSRSGHEIEDQGRKAEVSISLAKLNRLKR